METRNNTQQAGDAGNQEQQPQESRVKNPFKDQTPLVQRGQDSQEEETEKEQQFKEAQTERD